MSGFVTVLVAISLVWAGLILGVSFLATPVKFRAEKLTFDAAIDVGRVTFTIFSKIEWVLAAIVAVLSAVSGAGSFTMGLAALAVGAVLYEAIGLLPVLDRRAARIVAGEVLSPTWHHKAYVLLEAVKTLALVGLSLNLMSR